MLKRLMEATVPIPQVSVAGFIPDAGTPLPVIEMSDRGAIPVFLLAFIFPMSPTLPQPVEETIELLSVAQKYEMSSVREYFPTGSTLYPPSRCLPCLFP
jgi:hypothetical protein